MGVLIDNFAQLVNQNIGFALGAALLAGFLSSLSPCAIAAIPLVIGYVGGYAGESRKRSFVYTLTFCLGLALTFTALGAASALLGQMATGLGSWWYWLLGAFMSVIGLQMLGIVHIKIPFPTVSTGRKGIVGAFLLGLVGGIFSAPCATPVLIIILTIVAGQQQFLFGIVLLAAYAVGHCAVVMVCGVSVGFVQSYLDHPRSQQIAAIIKIFIGIVALIFAAYLFYTGM